MGFSFKQSLEIAPFYSEYTQTNPGESLTRWIDISVHICPNQLYRDSTVLANSAVMGKG